MCCLSVCPDVLKKPGNGRLGNVSLLGLLSNHVKGFWSSLQVYACGFPPHRLLQPSHSYPPSSYAVHLLLGSQSGTTLLTLQSRKKAAQSSCYSLDVPSTDPCSRSCLWGWGGIDPWELKEVGWSWRMQVPALSYVIATPSWWFNEDGFHRLMDLNT